MSGWGRPGANEKNAQLGGRASEGLRVRTFQLLLAVPQMRPSPAGGSSSRIGNRNRVTLTRCPKEAHVRARQRHAVPGSLATGNATHPRRLNVRAGAGRRTATDQGT